MNSFLFSAITLCLAAQCALAQYQSGPSYNTGYQQRKMAPTPQTYGAQAGYGMESGHYEAPAAYEQTSYRAPSSAAVSTYDERAPAASAGYAKAAPSYSKPMSYAAPAAYAKPAAPRYEEPYHPPMPFAWGYDINDGYGGAQYHKENGDEYGKRTGSYGYTDAYGIYRQVDYVADEHGFRATIKTNEPGTANESPADVELHAYEPPSNYYAGNQYQAAAPAKSSYAASPASYSAPASYSKPASYSAPRAYSAPKTSSYGRQAPSYEQAQYASSQVVPVYQKAAPKAILPAKRH